MFASTRTVTVALAAALLIASCGSDSDSSAADTIVTEATVADTASPQTTSEPTPESTEAMTDDTTDTTTTDTSTDSTTPSTEVPAQDVEADIAAAEAALLTLADLPEGWTETTATDDIVSEIDGRLAECVDVDSLTSVDAGAATGDFASADGSTVVNERVGFQPTELDARTVIARLTNPDVLDCFAAAYTELGAAALSPGAIADGAQIGEITASRLAVGSAGDATQAIRVVIPVDAAAPLTVDQVLVRSGRALATVTFEGRLEATPVETIDVITAAAAAHLPV